MTAALSARAAVQSNDFEFTILARTSADAQPTRLLAVLSRANGGVSLSWQQW